MNMDEKTENFNILEIAKNQKNILLLIIVNLIVFLFSFAIIIFFLMMSIPLNMVSRLMYILRIGLILVDLYFVYRMATSLKIKPVILWVVLSLIPLFNLIILIAFTIKATKIIRKAGFRVGLLGARIKDIKSKSSDTLSPAI